MATVFAGLLGSGAARAGFPPPPPPPPLPGDLHVHIVSEAPPPLRHEVVIARPSDHHVWVSGYWHHGGPGWVWVSGRWVVPPRPHAYWVSAHYGHVSGGWRYVPGHWSYERVVFY